MSRFLFGSPLWVPLLWWGCAKPTGVRGLEVEPDPAVEASELSLYDRRVAVVVGISDYADDSLDLDFARTDAEAVGELLERQYGFEVVRIFDEQATKERLVAAFDDLTTLRERDALLVFWGGHGATEPLPDGDALGYLVPYDGDARSSELMTTGLSMDTLRTILGRRVPAKHKFLVVDACYSGLLAVRDATLPPHTADYLRRITDETSYQVLTAGRADQTVLDGGPNGHSVFTNRLLKRLQTVDDFLTAEELSIDVRRKVQADAHDRNHRQTPGYGRILGTGDFVFVPTAAALEGGAPVVAPIDDAPLHTSADRLEDLVSNLHMRLMLLEGQKHTTVERLQAFLQSSEAEDYDAVLAYAEPQLADVLDIQSSWESALEELVLEDVELTRTIAWDIQRITGLLRQITTLPSAEAPARVDRVSTWTTELAALQTSLEQHQQALLAVLAD
ncbi:MAG: caspase family protein [Myxococcales bacterium]|nr:caspase family protein [Myxococcales bacterium]